MNVTNRQIHIHIRQIQRFTNKYRKNKNNKKINCNNKYNKIEIQINVHGNDDDDEKSIFLTLFKHEDIKTINGNNC